MTAKMERLHLRIDADDKIMLEAASDAVGESVSAFVMSAARKAAADVLADRRAFVLDDDAWRQFDNALDRPARDVPGLADLLRGPTAFDSPQQDDGR